MHRSEQAFFDSFVRTVGEEREANDLAINRLAVRLENSKAKLSQEVCYTNSAEELNISLPRAYRQSSHKPPQQTTRIENTKQWVKKSRSNSTLQEHD